MNTVKCDERTTRLSGLPYQRADAVFDPAAAVELLDIPNVVGIKDGRGDVDVMLRLVTAVRTSGHPRAAEFGFLNGLPTAELSARAYAAIGVKATPRRCTALPPTSPPRSTGLCATTTRRGRRRSEHC